MLKPPIPHEPPTDEERRAGAWSPCPRCRLDWPRRHITFRKLCLNCTRAVAAATPRVTPLINGIQPSYGTLKKYGLLAHEFTELLAAQNGCCPICNVTLTLAPQVRRAGVRKTDACIDHNHSSGVIRGILCSLCNRMLGHTKDDPTILERAAAYLRLHQETPGPFRKRVPRKQGLRLIASIPVEERLARFPPNR